MSVEADQTYPDPLPALDGRCAIVTGASAGLGRETARAFALAGAQVILAVRDQVRGKAVAAELQQVAQRGGTVRAEVLDVSDFTSVRSFAERRRASGEAIDILVHNAGIMATPKQMTPDGVEKQMATNHLGPFLLSAELLPCLLKAERARVVTITSDEAEKVKLTHMNVDQLKDSGTYPAWNWYGVTKLTSLAFSVELNERLKQSGRSMISTAAHPGLAATSLSHGVDGGLMRFFVRIGMGVAGQSARGGSRPSVHAATAADVNGGDLWAPGGLAGMRGKPVSKPLPKPALDPILRAEIWQGSVAITGADYGLLAGVSSRAAR